MIPSLVNTVGQGPFGSPSVFNFYLPDYQPPGDLIGYQGSSVIPNCNGVRSLFAPEFQILNAVTANLTFNRFRADVLDGDAGHTIWGSVSPTVTASMSLDFSEEEATLRDEGRVQLVQLLDLKLCHGTMSNATRSRILTRLNEMTDTDLRKAKAAVLAVVTSPDCAVRN